MRQLLPLVFLTVLVPAGLAAQKVPPVKNAPAQVQDVKGQVMDVKGMPVQQAQAINAAIQAVRGELGKGTFAHTWPIKSDGGGSIPPASVKSAGALFNPTGGKNGTPVWVVGVNSANGKGTLRVVVDARTGAVVPGAQVASFSWGAFEWGESPAWFKAGENSPPPARQ